MKSETIEAVKNRWTACSTIRQNTLVLLYLERYNEISEEGLLSFLAEQFCIEEVTQTAVKK